MRTRATHRSAVPTLSACVIASLALLGAACGSGGEAGQQSDLPASLRAISGFPTVAEASPSGADHAPEPLDQDRPGPADLEEDELGPLLGTFRLTYYWVAQAKPDEGKRDTVLLDRSCKPLAKVSRAFADRLRLEGTGRLRDGRIINVAGACDCDAPCYFIPAKRKRWGVGVAMRPLNPFRSVAVDIDHVSIGQLLYIPELDGLTMPGHAPWGGFVHDGCVVADDRGGNIRGQQLDFFTGRRSAYNSLLRRHRMSSVTVYDGRGRCTKDRGQVVASNRNSI